MDTPENNQSDLPPRSVIKEIMVEQEEKSRGALDPYVVTMNALNGLKERERDVIVNRYGLTDGQKVTLEEVGKKFNITRERVRQIESATLHKLAIHPTKDLTQLIRLINSHIVSQGGVIALSELVGYIRSPQTEQVELKTNALRLAMEVNDAVVTLPKTVDLKTGWMKTNFPAEVLAPMAAAVAEVLTRADRTMPEAELLE